LRVNGAWLALAVVCGLTACRDSNPVAPAPGRVTVTLGVSDSISRPIADAMVELRTGPDAGTTAATNAQGVATVTARSVDEDLTFRVSKPGFNSSDVTVSPPRTNGAVMLEPVRSVDLAGRHRLTIEASAECGELPAPARRRSYDALVTPYVGTSLSDISLSAAEFVSGHDRLGVSGAADAVRFWVSHPHSNEEPIIEKLSGDAYLMFLGDATSLANDTWQVLDARMSGIVSYCPASLDPGLRCTVPPISCFSASHRVILARRE
jgi:hypothetical protein